MIDVCKRLNNCKANVEKDKIMTTIAKDTNKHKHANIKYKQTNLRNQ